MLSSKPYLGFSQVVRFLCIKTQQVIEEQVGLGQFSHGCFT